MPRNPPEWHTAQVRSWLIAQNGALEWIYEYRHRELRVLVLRLAAVHAARELLGVNLDAVDWRLLVAEQARAGN